MWILVRLLLDIVPILRRTDEWAVVRHGCSDLWYTISPLLGVRLCWRCVSSFLHLTLPISDRVFSMLLLSRTCIDCSDYLCFSYKFV